MNSTIEKFAIVLRDSLPFDNVIFEHVYLGDQWSAIAVESTLSKLGLELTPSGEIDRLRAEIARLNAVIKSDRAARLENP